MKSYYGVFRAEALTLRQSHATHAHTRYIHFHKTCRLRDARDRETSNDITRVCTTYLLTYYVYNKNLVTYSRHTCIIYVVSCTLDYMNNVINSLHINNGPLPRFTGECNSLPMNGQGGNFILFVEKKTICGKTLSRCGN